MADLQREHTFPAYAALDRVASIGGVPLLPGVAVFTVCALGGVLASAALGPGGLLLALVGAPVLFWLRQVCETDDQALRLVWLELRSALCTRNPQLFGGTGTFCPVAYGRSFRLTVEQARRSVEPAWSPVLNRGRAEAAPAGGIAQ